MAIDITSLTDILPVIIEIMVISMVIGMISKLRTA